MPTPRTRRRAVLATLFALALLLFAPPEYRAKAQPAAASGLPDAGWTDLADLALASTVVLVVDLADIDRLGRREAPDVPAGQVRVLVKGKLRAALKAPSVLPGAAAWLWQGPADARGRPPFAKSEPVLLFAAPLPAGNDPGTQPLKLVSPGAQQPWSQEREAIVRDLLKAALAPGADGLMVTGINDAFLTLGQVAGSSESQFFLATAGGRPMTLLVRRSPGSQPQVRVATGDLVDRAAAVEPRTLTWRALACGLPAELPPSLAADAALRADYAFARESIGPCGRRLSPPR